MYFDIAKMINYVYYVNFDKEILFSTDAYTRLWEVSNASHKKASIYQMKDIQYKLLSLGLSYEKSTISKDVLLMNNRMILDTALMLDEDYYKKVKLLSQNPVKWKFFNFQGKEPIETLTINEHNRWTDYYLKEGWTYGKKDKLNKVHDCLKPLKDLEDRLKSTILYDLYAILYIPNYLASSGYELSFS